MSHSLLSIPACFQTSQLYKSLVENGEDSVDFPPQHFTFELPPPYPDTVENIIHQLETVQFWCLDEIPQYIFTALSHYRIPSAFLRDTAAAPPEVSFLNRNRLFMDFLEIYEYKKEIRLFLDIDRYGEPKLITCSKHGFTGLFKYLFHNAKQEIATSKKTALQKIRLENKLLSLLCRCQKTAAEYGQIEMLRLLLDIHIFDNLFPKLREYAARSSYKCMEYLVSVEREYFPVSPIKWTKTTCYMAAKHGKLDCLKFAQKSGADCNYEVACVAAKEGHYECYKYLCDSGLPLSADESIILNHTCDRCCWLDDGPITREILNPSCKWKYSSTNLAAANGHYNCLKYGIEAGCITTDTAFVFAAKYFHPECLFYLIELAMRKWYKKINTDVYPSYTISYLILRNELATIKKIWDTYAYCPFEPTHPTIAARCGNWEIAYYIMDKMDETGKKYSTCLARNACYSKSVECIKKMEERGFELSLDSFYIAADIANTDVFMYVATKIDAINKIFSQSGENSRVHQNILYEGALREGNLEIIKYLHSQGVLFCGNGESLCIRNGDYADCLEYIIDNHVCDKQTEDYAVSPYTFRFAVLAAKYNRIRCVRLLHEKYKYSLKGTLYWAISSNNIELLEYVWEYDKNSMTRNLYHTIVKNKYKAVREFIERNMNVNLLFRNYRSQSKSASNTHLARISPQETLEPPVPTILDK